MNIGIVESTVHDQFALLIVDKLVVGRVLKKIYLESGGKGTDEEIDRAVAEALPNSD